MRLKFLLIVFMMMSFSLPIWAHDFNERFELLERKVKESRQILDHKSLDDIETVKQHLTVMADIDRDVRVLFIDNINNTRIRQLLEEIDHFHTGHLKAILAIHGWINISKFGKEADRQAWLLVQHADHDPHFQTRCVSILEKLLPLNETDRKNYAYLYDRTALKRGLRQRYGTQAKIADNQIELLPFEGSLNDLNERRCKMSLEPIEEYLKTLKKLYIK